MAALVCTGADLKLWVAAYGQLSVWEELWKLFQLASAGGAPLKPQAAVLTGSQVTCAVTAQLRVCVELLHHKQEDSVEEQLFML